MAMNSSNVLGRRVLHFDSLNEVSVDARQIVASPHKTLGKWNDAQIIEHLAAAMDTAFDGAPFRAPWFARVLIAPFAKKSLLTKTMSAGFQLPNSAVSLLPSPDVDLTLALNHMERAVNRFKNEIPDKPHPFLGKLTPQEYVQLHLRHSEMHLSFIVPDSK